MDGDLLTAYGLGTTLAVEYALGEMVPRLEKAVA
jgi:hypothetical protein